MPSARLNSFILCLIWLVAIDAVSCQSISRPVRDNKKRIRPSILKGKEAPVSRFPYMCSLRQRGSREHKCGGVVIHPRWVLTAAHCVDPSFVGSVGLQPVIYCGIHGIDDDIPKLTFIATDGILHPRWNKKVEKGFDIAMLKLNKKSDSPIPEILAKNNALTKGSRFTALGWGKTENSYYSDKLHVTDDLVFVPPDTCRNNGYDVNDDSMVCAGLSMENTCEGDSGGPLLQTDAPKGDLEAGRPELDFLVGITSYSLGSCTDEDSTIGIYTHVGHYSEWIQSVISNKPVVNKKKTTETEPSDDDSSDDDDEMIPIPAPDQKNSAPPSDPETGLVDEFDSPVGLFAGLTDTELLKEMISALRSDDSQRVELLVEKGIDPNAVSNSSGGLMNSQRATLLHWAARYHAPKSAQILIDHGARVGKRNIRLDAPLHHCGTYNSPVVAEVLIENGANVDVKGNADYRPLHFASQHGSVRVVKVLLRSGADIEARDRFDDTSLHKASWKGKTKVVKVLIRGGANVSALTGGGWSALHLVAREGFPQMIEILLENDAEVDLPLPNGETPLHITAKEGHLDAAETLVSNGADLDARDAKKQTPLHLASWKDHREIVKLLVAEGASLTAVNDGGSNPLHYAAFYGCHCTVEILLENGADIDAREPDGETALHLGSRRGHTGVVEVLVDAGASKTATDTLGRRPIDVVCDSADPPCTESTRRKLIALLSS